MAARRGTLDEFSFAAEGMTGTAAAAALRRVRSLADQAPSGRMFAAIATLTDMSRRAESNLVAAHAHMANGNDHAASAKFGQALMQMDNLACAAAREIEVSMVSGKLRKSR